MCKCREMPGFFSYVVASACSPRRKRYLHCMNTDYDFYISIYISVCMYVCMYVCVKAYLYVFIMYVLCIYKC